MEGTDYTVNENGIPCCPHDSTLPMKREGSKSHLRSKLPAMKFVCPKMKWMRDKQTGKTYRKCHCDNPCTISSCGRMIYIYPEKNLRIFNQDCELVSQLPIIYVLYRKFYIFRHVKELSNFLVIR